MWAGSPAPTRPAGGRTCTHLSDAIHIAPACFSRASRTARLGPQQTPRGRATRPPFTSVAAAAAAGAAGKDAVPAIVSYVVQQGETLWDVAIQHGVSMRTIKDLNKLPGSEPVLTEGQQLLVPASGITAVATVDGATSAAALGSTPARGLWVGSDHVRLATVGEAKELYLRQCDRGNSQNTLLVLYAPWCPHCRDMEDELERLAEGLSHVTSVRVVAVNADCLEGRMFAREVLGVAYYPSIISFPEHSRTFFKYKGRQRDAESLLRFLNMTCCAREDAMWSLRPTGTTSPVVGVPGGKWVNQLLPVGTSPGAMATAVGLLALVAAAAAAAVAARRRAAAGGGGAAEAEMVAELDSSLGRMAVLMLRAVGTRLAFLLGMVGPSPPAAPAAEGAAVVVAAPLPPPAEVEVEPVAAAATVSGASRVAPSPAAVAAQRRRAARGHGDSAGGHPSVGGGQLGADSFPVDSSRVRATTAAEPPPPPQWSLRGSGAAATAVAVAPAAAATAALATTAVAAAVVDPSLVGARELSAEDRMRLTRLTDDELIALVNSDPDLDKVLSRLLGDK